MKNTIIEFANRITHSHSHTSRFLQRIYDGTQFLCHRIPKWAGRIDFSDLHGQTGLIAIKPHRNDPKSQSLVRQYSLPSGIDDTQGTNHHVSGSHYVKCTDDEFRKWTK